MPLSKYKLQFTESARNDQKEFRRYIVKEFGYKGYGRNFDNKMKSAVKAIKAAASSIRPTSLYYREYNIYMLVHKTYLFFYVVDETTKTITVIRVMQDGMDWMNRLKRWTKQN